MSHERLDPITFEVLRHSFVALVDEMGARLARSAFSPVITQGRDFSLALFDSEGRLVASGHWDMPAHFGTFEFTIREVLKSFGPDDVSPGDVFLFNDPYTGGTHNQDVRAVRPVFVGDEVFAWMVALGHWPDVGGPTPGSFNPEARDCYSEGLRIPPIKIYESGRRVDSIIELVFANMRGPAERHGDLEAQLQSLLLGERRVRELVEKYGADTVRAAFSESWDYAERALRAQTELVADGTYSWTDYIDEDPGHPDRHPVKVALTLTVAGGELSFDFRESDDAPVGAVGSSLPSTWSAVLTSVLNLFPGVPLNHGVHRVVSVETRPSSAVHVLPPTPCSGMAAGAFEKITASCLAVVGQADPARRAACHFNIENLTLGGHDERLDRDYVMYLWIAGGFGATARGDSTLPSSMLFGPGVRNQPVEVNERLYPVIFDRVELRQDSAGAGRYRGGWGIDYEFHVTSGHATLTIMGDRGRFPIWGTEGGGPGGRQELTVSDADGGERAIGMFATDIDIGAEQQVLLRSGGGGGYGDPLDREPALVLADVRQGLLTVEAARDGYAVVIASSGEEQDVDWQETSTLREARSRGVAQTQPPQPSTGGQSHE